MSANGIGEHSCSLKGPTSPLHCCSVSLSCEHSASCAKRNWVKDERFFQRSRGVATRSSDESVNLQTHFDFSRFGAIRTNESTAPRLALGGKQHCRRLWQIIEGRVPVLPWPRQRFRWRSANAAYHCTGFGFRLERVFGSSRISCQRSWQDAGCDDEQIKALSAGFLFPIPCSLHFYPGGHANALPPSKCRCRCSTVCPPSSPVFTTIR